MNDIYEYKSKKYKYKYLKLKKQYIGEGGADVIQDFFSNIFKGSNDLIKGSQDFIKGILPETNNNKSIGEEDKLITYDYTIIDQLEYKNIINNIKKKIKEFFDSFFKRSTYFISLKNNKKFITQFNDDTDVIEIIEILNDHYYQLFEFRNSIENYHNDFKDVINKSNRKFIRLNGGDMTSDVIDFFKSPGNYISIFSNPNTESNNINPFNMISSQKKKIYPIKSSIEDLYLSFIRSSSNIIDFIFNKSFINQLDNNNDTEVTKIINDYYFKIIELKNLIKDYYYKFSQLKSSIEIHYTELIRLKDELYNNHNALIKDIKGYNDQNIDLINNILNEKKNDISKYEKFIDYKEFIILTKDIIRTLYKKKLELIKNEYNFLNNFNCNFLSLDKLLTTQINVNEKIKPEKIELKKIITKRIKVINKAIEEKKFLKELKNKTINDIDQEILNTIDETYLNELLKNINDEELIKKINQKILLTSTYNMIINKNYDIQYDENGIEWLKYNNKIVEFITEIDKPIIKIKKSISFINTILSSDILKKFGKIRDKEELDELKKILNDNLSNLLIFKVKLEEHISIFFYEYEYKAQENININI
jgi:hypothetical protein